LGEGWRVQASYVGSRGNHLFRRYEINQFPVPLRQPDGSLFFPARAGAVNPVFGSMTTISTDAQAFYNSLQITANVNPGKSTSLQASYNFSRTVDDSTVGSVSSTNQYGLMRGLDRGLSDFDIRHRLVFNYFFNVPFGSGRHWLQSGALSSVLRGWRLGGIVTLRRGTPFTAQVNVRYKDYLFVPTRPNLRAGRSNNPIAGATAGCGPVQPGKLSPELYFDPCAFEPPPPGTLGNLGRNTLIGPSIFNTDISIQREFSVDGKRRVQFRADIFNWMNHTNFNSPSTGSALIFSGESASRSSRAGRLNQTNTTARQIQFALRLSF